MCRINIKSSLIYLGDDLLVTVTNENAHIGAVVVAFPYEKDNKVHATLSTINRIEHKDDEIAKLYAKELCTHFNKVVTVVAGVHLDNISKEEISKCIEIAKMNIKSLLDNR